MPGYSVRNCSSGIPKNLSLRDKSEMTVTVRDSGQIKNGNTLASNKDEISFI